MDEEVYQKVTEKKEYSSLPRKDVLRVYSLFEKRQVSESEKIRLTREMLHKVYSVFTSPKLLSPKDKSEEWILRKHLSTRERIPYYRGLYERLFDKEKTVIDLGAGVNGFSYKFFPRRVKYVAFEPVGQLVDLVNFYFKKKNFPGKAFHGSLFSIKLIEEEIKKTKSPRIIFLFKVIDSLEMVERNYSKKILDWSAGLAEKVVISFATESISKRKRFRAERSWVRNYLEENFKILDEFSLGPERYLVFSKK